MSTQIYTQEEISNKINNLTIKLRSLYDLRKDINQQIREQLINIKYWSEIDLSQTKLFKD